MAASRGDSGSKEGLGKGLGLEQRLGLRQWLVQVPGLRQWLRLVLVQRLGPRPGPWLGLGQRLGPRPWLGLVQVPRPRPGLGSRQGPGELGEITTVGDREAGVEDRGGSRKGEGARHPGSSVSSSLARSEAGETLVSGDWEQEVEPGSAQASLEEAAGSQLELELVLEEENAGTRGGVSAAVDRPGSICCRICETLHTPLA